MVTANAISVFISKMVKIFPEGIIAIIVESGTIKPTRRAHILKADFAVICNAK